MQWQAGALLYTSAHKGNSQHEAQVGKVIHKTKQVDKQIDKAIRSMKTKYTGWHEEGTKERVKRTRLLYRTYTWPLLTAKPEFSFLGPRSFVLPRNHCLLLLSVTQTCKDRLIAHAQELQRIL